MPSKRRRFTQLKRVSHQFCCNYSLFSQKSSKPLNQEPASPTEQGSSSQEFEIDQIDDHRILHQDKQLEFYVRWKGYGLADRTWEKFEMFAYDAPDEAQKYLIKALSKKNKEQVAKGSKKASNQEEDKEEQKVPLVQNVAPVSETQMNRNGGQPAVLINGSEKVPTLVNKKIKIIQQLQQKQSNGCSEYLPEQQKKIGFLVEVLDPEPGQASRQIVMEEELIKTHCQDMYYFIQRSIKFEKKVQVPKRVLLDPKFEARLTDLVSPGGAAEQSNGMTAVSDCRAGVGETFQPKQ